MSVSFREFANSIVTAQGIREARAAERTQCFPMPKPGPRRVQDTSKFHEAYALEAGPDED